MVTATLATCVLMARPYTCGLARTLGPMGVTAQSYMRAPIGVLLAALLLGEALTASMLAGLVLVVIGVAAMTLPNMWREAKA